MRESDKARAYMRMCVCGHVRAHPCLLDEQKIRSLFGCYTGEDWWAMEGKKRKKKKQKKGSGREPGRGEQITDHMTI